MNATKENSGKSDLIGYTHNFERYFTTSDIRIDRLELILTHGLISPREASLRNIPYKVNFGRREAENLVFVMPVYGSWSTAKPWSIGETTLLIYPDAPVLTFEQLRETDDRLVEAEQWPREMYARGVIGKKHIAAILSGPRIEEVMHG